GQGAPCGADRRATLGGTAGPRRRRERPRPAQLARSRGARARAPLRLRLLGRCLLRRAGNLPRGRGASASAGLALRRLQGRERAVPRLLLPREEAPLRRAPLLERLRAAAGSAGRSG